jgi:hypothetical protein
MAKDKATIDALVASKAALEAQMVVVQDKAGADAVAALKVKALDSRIVDLEAQIAKDKADWLQLMEAKTIADTNLLKVDAELIKLKASADQLTRSKALSESKVAQLEAAGKKDGAHLEELFIAKAASLARIAALESQLEKEKVDTDEEAAARERLASRVAELESQLKIDRVVADATMKAKMSNERRLLEMEEQSKRDKAAVGDMASEKAAADTRLAEIEALLKEAALAWQPEPTTFSATGDTFEPPRAGSSSASASGSRRPFSDTGTGTGSTYSDMKMLATSDDEESDEASKANDLSFASDSSRALGSESDELDTIPNECGDSDDDSGDVTCLWDRARDKKLVYKKFVGRIFENLKLRKAVSGSQKSTPSFKTFMVNSIVRVEGKKQLFFVYYDVLAYPKGPPSKKDASAWTLCPCRHLIGKTTTYRFK